MKSIRKVLIGMIAMTMLLGMTAMAAGTPETTYVAAASIKITPPSDVKGGVIYADKDEEDGKPIPVKVKVTYQSPKSKGKPVGVTVSSSNRGVVTVDKTPLDVDDLSDTKNYIFTGTVKLTPVANGTATITVKDNWLGSKKKATLKVTVKTHVTEINVANAEDDGTDEVVYIAKTSGKVQLQTSVNADATDKKLKFTTGDKNIAGVNAKGIVTVNKNAATGKSTFITISSNDKNITDRKVKVEVKDADVQSIQLKADSTTGDGYLTQKGKNFNLTLKGNKLSGYKYSYKLNLGENLIADTDDYDTLKFTSSNENVATVDSEGKIMAAGNGKAVITVEPVLGNNTSAKINVAVDTKVTTLNLRTQNNKDYVLANNKDSVTFVGTTNADASQKGVKYSIDHIEAGTTTSYDPKVIKTYASITNKGVVKAKQACDIYVKAQPAEKESTVESINSVRAITPVDSLEIKLDASNGTVTSGAGKKLAATMWRGEDGGYTDLYLSATAKMKDQGAPKGTHAKSVDDYPNVRWTSSNWDIAYFDWDDANNQVYVRPYKNGTVKITATDTLTGKNATFSLTVKTDAYMINVPKAVNDTVYVENSTKPIDLKKVVAAATNADASNKNVAYYDASGTGDPILIPNNKITLAKDETKEILVKAVEACVVSSGYAENTVTLEAVDRDKIAQNYKFDEAQDDSWHTVFAGQKWDMVNGDYDYVDVDIKPSDDNTYPIEDLTKLKWSSSNTKVAKVDKNGILTGVAKGTATITATFTSTVNKSATCSKTFNVAVGRSGDQVDGEFRKSLAEELNAENRDYLGANVKLQNRDITITILDPERDIKAMEGIGSGLVDSVKNVLGGNFRAVELHTSDGSAWRAERTSGAMMKVGPRNWNIASEYEDGAWTYGEAMNETDAVQYMLRNHIGDKKLLRDWAGEQFLIYIDLEETVMSSDKVVGTFGYKSYYYVNVALSDSVHLTMTDADISGAVEKLNGKIAGIESIIYDAPTKVVSVIANNPDQNIREMDQACRNDIKEILMSADSHLDDVASIAVSAEVNGITWDEIRDKKEGTSIEESIDGLINDYLAKLDKHDIKTYADADGLVANIKVTYRYGYIVKDVVYTVNFGIADETYQDIIDQNADAAITRAVALAGSVYQYDKATNTVTAKYEEDGSILTLATGAMDDILDAMINQAKVDTARDIKISLGTKTVDMKAGDTTLKRFDSIIKEFNLALISDLNGKPITVAVPYNHNLVLTYTIVVEVKVTQDVSGNSASQYAEDVDETPDEAIEETPDETPEDVDDLSEEAEEPAEEETATEEPAEEEVSVEDVLTEEAAVEVIAES